MKLLRIIAIMFCLGAFAPLSQVYAGTTKASSVSPRNLSVEELAKMVYEAAKKDPSNAPMIFAEAIASRDSWTRGELLLVSEALLMAVPSMTPGDIPSLIIGIASFIALNLLVLMLSLRMCSLWLNNWSAMMADLPVM